MQIDQYQGITLYAFFEALSQQTVPLPADLQQQMLQIGEIFETNTKDAIDRLADLAQNSILQPAYKAARQEKQGDYNPIELNDALLDPENPDGEPRILLEELDNSTVVDFLRSPNSQESLSVLEKIRSILFKKIL